MKSMTLAEISSSKVFEHSSARGAEWHHRSCAAAAGRRLGIDRAGHFRYPGIGVFRAWNNKAAISDFI